jgi:predicted nucleic acid-binding Zn ribbon protein
MGKASDWLREERRKVLGHWVSVCLQCGGGRRWFEEFEHEVDDTCTVCGGPMLRRCPACNAPFSSLFAIDCEECGKPLRPETTTTGIRIRKAGAPPTPKPAPEED